MAGGDETAENRVLPEMVLHRTGGARNCVGSMFPTNVAVIPTRRPKLTAPTGEAPANLLRTSSGHPTPSHLTSSPIFATHGSMPPSCYATGTVLPQHSVNIMDIRGAEILSTST